MYDWMAYLAAGKTALDILKGIRDALPKGEKSDEAQKQIEKAEQALKASEAELAKGLGFRLCRCEFPPPIMLWDKDKRVHVCPECADIWPRRAEIGVLKANVP